MELHCSIPVLAYLLRSCAKCVLLSSLAHSSLPLVPLGGGQSRFNVDEVHRSASLSRPQAPAIKAIILRGPPVLLLPQTNIDFGRQRMWGAVGWGLISYAAGSAVQHFSIYAVFAMGACVATLAFPVAVALNFAYIDRTAASKKLPASYPNKRVCDSASQATPYTPVLTPQLSTRQSKASLGGPMQRLDSQVTEDESALGTGVGYGETDGFGELAATHRPKQKSAMQGFGSLLDFTPYRDSDAASYGHRVSLDVGLADPHTSSGES